MRRLLPALLSIVLLAPAATALLGAAPAVAQDQGDQGDQAEGQSEDPSEERATEFRAVQGPVTEDVPGGVLMLSAYIVIWVLIFGYVLRLGRIAQATRRDVDRLTKSLDAKGD